MIDAYTDYPITEYGDIENEIAPIRKVKILTYDRDKYCEVMVFQVDDDGNLRDIITSFKACYLYKNEARLEEGILFTDKEIETLPWTW